VVPQQVSVEAVDSLVPQQDSADFDCSTTLVGAPQQLEDAFIVPDVF
jgi:hypothetical protein